MPTYELLSDCKNPEYDADYWGKIRTLYEGAKTMRDVLATNCELRQLIFPRRLGEDDEVYEERCRQACYSPHMTQLIDYILSVLFSDPIEMTAGGKGDDLGPGSVDPFYDEFFKNTARPGARPVTFNQLLRSLAKDALLYRRTWVQVDFPSAPVDPATGERRVPQNRAEEEAMKLDRAYCCPLDPECVYDWETNEEDGELDWVLVRDLKKRRGSVDEKRNKCVESFTVYDRQGWTRYVWEYMDSRRPGSKSEPTRVQTGKHTFGRVPVLPVELPEGLWAGGKMESLAIEIFNARSALSWSRNRSLFQMIVAKLSNPDPLNPVTEDPDRGIDQVVGPGRVITMAEKDSYEFVGPKAEPFKEAREDIRDLVNDLHRVLHQMAQSTPQSASSQRQSGESKQMDMTAGAVVSKELGRLFRDIAIVIYSAVSQGRNEEQRDWHSKGLSEFDDVSLESFVSEAAVIETVPIASPLFQTLYKYDLAARLLPGATDEQLDKIYEELSAAHTAEAMIDDKRNEQMLEDPLNRNGAQASPDEDGAEKKGEDEGDDKPPKEPEQKGKETPPQKVKGPPKTNKRPAKSSKQPRIVT